MATRSPQTLPLHRHSRVELASSLQQPQPLVLSLLGRTLLQMARLAIRNNPYLTPIAAQGEAFASPLQGVNPQAQSPPNEPKIGMPLYRNRSNPFLRERTQTLQQLTSPAFKLLLIRNWLINCLAPVGLQSLPTPKTLQLLSLPLEQDYSESSLSRKGLEVALEFI